MRKELSFNTKTELRISRAAFTLPEMLVAVGLMLLVMSLFAEIFSLAVTAMTTQVGLAKNDQRARTAFIVIDNDLKRMSYRPLDGHKGIVPLVPGLKYNGEDAGPQQQGYIYYSENNPLDDTDDVLQFTILGSQDNNRYPDQNLNYYGRASSLTSNSAVRDQPDWDDGTPGDNVSVSEQAEVVYFLRHGTLYRRILLLRNATSIPNNLQEFDSNNDQKLAQPAVFSGGNPVDLMIGYSGNFYSDFDYSAHFGTSPYDGDLSPPPSSPNQVAIFHGSLSNTATNNWPLGVPHFRFGHHPLTGIPREYFTTAGNDYFFGRYTHEETSNTNFQYPDNNSGNVFGRNDFNLNFYQNTGRLDVFANGSRRGSDILMNNVQSFDVEIWDEAARRFVDIGNSGGHFSTANNLNSAYGPIKPNAGQVNVFDTWHSAYNMNALFPDQSNIGSRQPPYVPKNITAGVGVWQVDTQYSVGARVIPSASYRSNVANEHDLINGAVYYECVVSGWSAELPGDEPNWPRDTTVTGSFSDGPNTIAGPPAHSPPAVWKLVDNRRPIRALRIIIRFHDPNSDQMRQVTIVHSFNDDLE